MPPCCRSRTRNDIGSALILSLALLTAAALAGSSSSTPLIAERRALAEWAKAENRKSCAPLALAAPGTPEGTPRAANFSGGWAVAFDLPGLRSAYGFAGVGLLPADRASPSLHRRHLKKQWPYFRELGRLSRPSFAGYGVEGAEAYPLANTDGIGLHSLAYMRVSGQRCTYNVWSRISRAHLEWMLDNLRLIRR